MTHPDILKMERLGYLDPELPVRQIGECQYCGRELYDDGSEITASTDGKFCDLACCHEYYEIHSF